MSDVIVFAVRNAIHSDRVRDFCWLHSSRMSRKKGVACRHVIRNTTWIPLNVVDNQNSPNKDEREIGSIQLHGVDTNCLWRKLWTVQWTIIVTLLSKTDSVESEIQLHLQQNTAKDYCSLLLKNVKSCNRARYATFLVNSRSNEAKWLSSCKPPWERWKRLRLLMTRCLGK